jgi:transketolase
MEHPYAMGAHSGLYPWHSGAPDDLTFRRAFDEIHGRVNADLAGLGLAALSIKDVEAESPVRGSSASGSGLLGEPVSQAARVPVVSSVSSEYVAQAYGDALVDLARDNPHLVVLDADLAADCRVRGFESAYPERFLEFGIAEQDMVSTAGGLARMGLLPVVNSFASFLAARANEQIYNNAGEGTKVIYACHYAGLIPAGPGKSHQSIRDISLLAAIPNITILQPCNAEETRMTVEYSVSEAEENCVLRLIIGPSPRLIELPKGYRLTFGRGAVLADGKDALLFGYGPVMLNEALLAAEVLQGKAIGLCVVDMPWLNRVDDKWLNAIVRPYRRIYVMEDHSPVGGLGDHLRRNLAGMHPEAASSLEIFGVEGYPACGRPKEVLEHHKLDGQSIARRILLDRQRQR